MDRVELKPCPKCRSTRIVIDQMSPKGGRYTRYCEDCDWSTATYETPEEATTAWNAAIAAIEDGWEAKAREAFLNMLADAFDFHDEPDGDETGDHTRFVIITGWRQLAELAEAVGIKGPRYMETWADALNRAIAGPLPPPPEGGL